MIKKLARLFARPQTPLQAQALASSSNLLTPVQMHWFADTGMPIPDWQRIGEAQPAGLEHDTAHAYWNSAALSWLDAIRTVIGSHHRIAESEDFMLLSSLDDRAARVFLATCQRMLARIGRSLGPLADDSGTGKYVVMVFEDPDDYYAYIGHYQPEGGEYAMSSGCYIQAGYGHFVMPMEAVDNMEPVIAHELTHCLLGHLPLPAWLNEGLAVNTEHALFPQLASPAAQLYLPHEIADQHAAYWDADSIQAFWSGKSFLRTDEGNRLSYDLAEKITRLAASNEADFRAFVAQADMRDGGVAAAELLGYPVDHLMEAVLGEGPWEPRPELWGEGVEGGQFRVANGGSAAAVTGHASVRAAPAVPSAGL